MHAISQSLQEVLLSEPGAEPKLFFFVEASSGMGKSQLAHSLGMPVVYIPLNVTQKIYQCYTALHTAVLDTLKHDFNKLPSDNDLQAIRSHSLGICTSKLRTVGLLVALFKAVYGKTNEESIKFLSGFDIGQTVHYRSMTIAAARDELEQMTNNDVQSRVGASASSTFPHQQVKTPLFVIDEVPPKDHQYYNFCILLRNLIRCMNCTCLLSGTEAATMNAIDNIPGGSRGEVEQEYLRLITRLPHTRFEVFESDSRYAALLTELEPDFRAMLKRTRPLFVQFLLDKMLDSLGTSGSSGTYSVAAASSSSSAPAAVSRGLTCALLSAVKEIIVDKKLNFGTSGGLYAQLALIHSWFLSYTVKDVMEKSRLSGFKRANDDTSVEILSIAESLQVDRQFCVRHHFGQLRIANELSLGDDPTVSLFVQENKPTKVKTNLFGRLEAFRPNVIFAKPSEDELLYLICLRNGLYFNNYLNLPVRVSTSFAHKNLYEERHRRNMTMMLNPNQPSCSGKFLEMETISAAIIASHSYCNSLAGCPLPFFLTAMVAELNIALEYIPQESFELMNMPSRFQDITVGLLSPASSPWLSDSASDHDVRQRGTIMLSNCTWSTNADQNDGAFPLERDRVTYKGSLEAKCHAKNVPTAEIKKTISNNFKNKHLLTVMVVTKLVQTDVDKIDFIDCVTEGNVNVYKICGSLRPEETVSRTLNCIFLRGPASGANANTRTVIVIVLETIFRNRYIAMQAIYQST